MDPLAIDTLHNITQDDVDKFLENVLKFHPYCHEKIKQVAHRRLIRVSSINPKGLVLEMTLLLTDLACGIDGFDKNAYMPTLPMAHMIIQPAMYGDLWKHLPAEFVEELRTETDNDPKKCCVM